MFFAATAMSQYYVYQPMYHQPWDGNVAISINGGALCYFARPAWYQNKYNFQQGLGYTFVSRYDYDKNFGGRWSWGYTSIIGYATQSFRFTDYLEVGDGEKFKGEYDIATREIPIGADIILGYWLNDNIELVAGLGIRMYWELGHRRYNIKYADLSNGNVEEKDDDLGGFNIQGECIATHVAVKYFFTPKFFVHGILQDNIGVSIKSFNPNLGNRFAVYLGVGYKFIKEE